MVFGYDEEDPECGDGGEDLGDELEIGDDMVKVFGDSWGFVYSGALPW